jgi:DNA-binding FadR family transcriptional regulator
MATRITQGGRSAGRNELAEIIAKEAQATLMTPAARRLATALATTPTRIVEALQAFRTEPWVEREGTGPKVKSSSTSPQAQGWDISARDATTPTLSDILVAIRSHLSASSR